MLSEMHKAIAGRVFEFVRKEFCVELDYNSYISGSVAPDYLPNMILLSHDMKGTLELVGRYMREIRNGGIPTNKRNLSSFSFRLGIITHFLSDYFCKFHNGEFAKKDMVSHYRYENKLNKFFKKALKKEKFNEKVGKNIHKHLLDNDTDTIGFILDFHKKYKEKKGNKLNDCKYSVIACTVVVSGIVRQLMVKEMCELLKCV